MSKPNGPNDGHQFHDRKAEVEFQKTISAAPAAMESDTQPTSTRLSASRNLTRLPISEIVVGARLRALDDEKVLEIAESMARTALRHPITVRRVGDQILLVAGRHRLEGAKVLGWQDIDAEFIVGDEIDVQLWEIAENLFRADKGISRAARELPLGAKSEEARRKEIGRALKVNAICPEAKAAAKAAGLDTNRSALLKVANEPTAELQVKKTNEIVAGKASKQLARTAGAFDQGSNSSIKSEIDQSKPMSKPELHQSKPASIAVLVEFAKFIPHISQNGKIVLTLTAAEDVKEFNRLADRSAWCFVNRGRTFIESRREQLQELSGKLADYFQANHFENNGPAW
jgi:ParB-like chromosome segregation protein Spo0J